MIFIQALRKNDINPNGGKQVEFSKPFFESFKWTADSKNEVLIHSGKDDINTTLTVRGSQRGGVREGTDCKEYANSDGSFPLKEYLIKKFSDEHVGNVFMIFESLDTSGKEFNLYFTPYKRTKEIIIEKDSPLFPLQKIFYGAPGTGKSYNVKSEKLAGVPEENIFRTTFHPDYDYASFVGCYKPTKEKMPLLDHAQLLNVFGTISEPHKLCKIGFLYWESFDKIDNKTRFLKDCGKETQSPELNAGIDMGKNFQQNNSSITYSFIPQVFTKAYIKAWKEMKQENPQPVYLVIEEINRGNCAQIFGDIFQLLDRNEKGYSEYPIDIDEDLKNYLVQQLGADSEGIKDGKLCLPPNLNLLATMNTSDQSLFPIDSAFKRRWDWEFVPIRYSKDEAKDEKDNFHTFEIEIGDKKYKWTDFLQKVNAKILSVTDSEDKQMGEYFIKKSVDQKTFINKVMYYLWSEVGKDMYGSTNPFFVQKTKYENGQDVENQFSFNDLFKGNATQLLQGFMEKLEVKIEEEKAAEKAATSATPAEV